MGLRIKAVVRPTACCVEQKDELGEPMQGLSVAESALLVPLASGTFFLFI
jgi:hypothetical protein